MANATTFVNGYCNSIVQLVQLMESLRTNNDQIDSDPTLLSSYFEPPPPTNGPQFTPPPRKDITEEDVMNAHSALVQLLFAFDSGSPTQKSYLYKVLP